ncbi:hypothetical protein BGX28_008749 [Mortierella sp. GBA30]|nr:hypothetical protein BGX28_008749 [Mortierella sp. GBA30]
MPDYSQSTKMALVAVAASVTTAAVLFGYQGSLRKHRNKHLKHDDRRRPSHSVAPSNVERTPSGQHDHHIESKSPQQQQSEDKIEFDEELVLEQLARNIAFLGEDGVQKLRDSFVIVVGAGSIGSWAASMLIKSGVGKIRIVDYGQVTLSGLNQHATANRMDIGTPKACAMKKAFRTIAPWVQVDARVERLQEDSAEVLLSGSPDYVVDAIGDISSKLELLKYCFDNKIPVMSALGAGAKADPSRVQISDISDTFEDPLARAVRRRMKKLGVDTGIDVVFSTEKPYKATPADGNVTQQQMDGYSPLPKFGSSQLPILGPLPAMFGMSMATFITCKIAGWAMDPLPTKFRMELYQRLHRDLKLQEESRYPTTTDIPLDRRDVGYVVEEMFRGRSAVSQSMDRIALCRWRRNEPLNLLNVVALTQKEMERHLALPLDADLEMVYGKSVVEYIADRFKEEEQISRLH